MNLERLNQMQLIEMSPIGMALCRMDRTPVYVNQAFANIVGYSQEEMKGICCIQLTPPKYEHQEESWYKQLNDEGYYGPYEKEYIHKDGHLVHVRLKGVSLEFEGEQLIWSTVEQIDDVRQVEEQLKSVIEGASLGYWDWNYQTGEHHVNDRWLDMLGLTREDITNTVKDWEDRINTEDKKVVQRIIEGALKSGETYVAEFRMRHTDGHWVWIQGSGAVTLYDPNSGEPIRICGTHQDISERKSSEKELQRLSQAIQYSGESVMITNLQGDIEYVNPAFTEITGYSPGEVLGENPRILKSKAQDPKFYTELWDTITNGEVWKGTLIDRRKDGSYYPALMSVAPIKSEGGAIKHFVATQRNMTAHQELEEQLRQSQKMESIGTLVGGIAHDFNNALATIDGNVYLAKRNLDAGSRAVEKLDAIQKLSSHSANMVKQLMVYARKDNVTMTAIDLSFLMQDGFNLVKNVIPENIEHSCETCAEKLIIEADGSQLQQMLMNLLNNACDAVAGVQNPQVSCSNGLFTADDAFMAKHPHLKTRALAKVTVRDNGCGVSEEHLGKIMDPFFTTKGVGEGTGLGLSMVYGSIKRHEGTYEIESDLGAGTAFHIYLPLTHEEVVAESADILSWEGNGETILVVDDQEVLLDITSQILESLNYKVLKALNGEEGLLLFKANQASISLVVTDIIMPKVGGLELAKRVWELNEHVPVVFVSGYNTDHHDFPGHQESKSIKLSKPYSVDDLGLSVRKLLNR